MTDRESTSGGTDDPEGPGDGTEAVEESGDVKRRTYLEAITAAGGVGAIGATVGLGGLASRSANAQPDPTPETSVLATFCGQFSGGPQIQQCLDCVEAACPGEEVNPLYPIFTGLTGSCFSPASIPDGADWVTLKAGQNCYVAPVPDGATTFCLPPGQPDISNATFYRCGGEPTPAVTAVDVTCDEIAVTTENVPDGTTLTATVTFIDAGGDESEETYQATVTDNAATFALPGDLSPSHLVLSIGETVLYDQEVLASDAPCVDPSPPPTPDPRLESIDVTCDAITVATADIPAGEVLSVTVSFAGGLVETYEVPVDANGAATVPLPGDVDPSHIEIVYDTETLFDMDVQAADAPCAEPPTPPEPPEPPKPPKNKKELRKEMRRYERRYKRYKRKYEMYKKMLEKTD